MISTLVAGIDALSGSKSPIDAMFRKLLFILSKNCLAFPFPVFCARPAPFLSLRPTKERARNCACASSARSGAKVPEERGRERLGDVMSLLSFSHPPPPLSLWISLFSFSFSLFLYATHVIYFPLLFVFQFSSVDFCSAHFLDAVLQIYWHGSNDNDTIIKKIE